MLTVKEASEMLGLKPATLRNWQARRKNLPFVRCGRSVRIPADAIERFILENTVPVREKKAVTVAELLEGKGLNLSE